MSEAKLNTGFILIVDDEPRNTRLLEGMLEFGGYRTRTADSGEESLRLLAEERIDMVLLDVMMPGIDGFEVCKRIKADPATRTIPVLLVTALSETARKVQGLDSGADDFITKPVERAELLARVRTHLRMKSLLDDVQGLLEDVRLSREEVQSQNQRLVRLEQSRQDLVSMLVHDLKSPLLAMQLGIELLQGTGGETSGRSERTLRNLNEAGRKLGRMVHNILDVSRIEEAGLAINARDLSLSDLAAQVAAAFQPVAREEGRDILVTGDIGATAVSGDADLLTRVLENLLANALDHSEGDIRIEVEPAAGNAAVQVTVADRGCGVPEHLRSAIFEKYTQGATQGARRFGNQGLGLSFCKLALAAHGGRIWVEPRDGGGSLFRFVVPEKAGTSGGLPEQEAVVAGGVPEDDRRQVLAVLGDPR